MLPERWSRLLTAYVDGELTARESRMVAQLLQRSAEARQLLQKLQSDSDRLKALSRRRSERDLSVDVLQALAEQPLPPVVVLPARVRLKSTPGWIQWAVAAAVLLAAGAAVYLAWSSAPPARDNPPLVKRKVLPDKSVANVPVFPPDPPAVNPVPQVEPVPPEPVALAKEPAEPEPVLDLPDPKFEVFLEVHDPKQTLVLSLRELDGDHPKRLLQDLPRFPAYRAELSCADPAVALERLHAAFKERGVRLVIDQAAQERLLRQLRTNYVVYAENVTAEEVEQLLLSALGPAASHKLRADVREDPLARIILNGLQPADRDELSKLLGIDPARLQPTKPKAPLGVDVRKPLSEQTVDQLAKALKNKQAERLAIVLPYNPVRPRPAASKEVKQFLDNRQEPRPGTVQMLLVLRGSKS